MARQVACVFGASGFVGRHLVRRLGAAGWRVRAAVRYPASADYLRPMGDVGQIVPMQANIQNEASVRAAVAGADVVINLVGILYQRGKRSFQAVHVEAARRIAAAAKAAGASRLVHVSALGADKGAPSAYARTKADGEEAVRSAFPEAVIFRPSLIFGPEDDFFNRFAEMTSWSPILPVVVSPGHKDGPKFQPVYVGDVADALMLAITSDAHAGKTFSLGGPRVYSMREVMQLVLGATRRHRGVWPVSAGMMGAAATFLQFLPVPPITPDQVRQLTVDNVVPAGEPGLGDLGIRPTAAEAVAPGYLARFSNPFIPRERGRAH